MNQFLRRYIGLQVQHYSAINSYEVRLAKVLSDYDVDLVIDVGANEGQFGDLLRSIGYHGKMVSFEPLSTAHQKLLSHSSLDERWNVPARQAIGDTTGEITIHVSGNSVSSSLLPMLSAHRSACDISGYIDKETVSMTTLDAAMVDLSDNCQKVFLKIDTQGYEAQVLDGASSTLKVAKVVQLELSVIPLYQGQALIVELICKMETLGFQMHSLAPVFNDPHSSAILQYDGLFVRGGFESR